MEIAGVAHLQLTVNDLQRAVEFYERVLGYLGLRPAMRFPGGLYMVGGKTAVMITQSSKENREIGFDQRRIGLHHQWWNWVCAGPKPADLMPVGPRERRQTEVPAGPKAKQGRRRLRGRTLTPP